MKDTLRYCTKLQYQYQYILFTFTLLLFVPEDRIELSTLALWVLRSNQLSYPGLRTKFISSSTIIVNGTFFKCNKKTPQNGVFLFSCCGARNCTDLRVFGSRRKDMLLLPLIHLAISIFYCCLLRGPELHRGLEVMSLSRYYSSTPRCLTQLVFA